MRERHYRTPDGCTCEACGEPCKVIALDCQIPDERGNLMPYYGHGDPVSDCCEAMVLDPDGMNYTIEELEVEP